MSSVIICSIYATGVLFYIGSYTVLLTYVKAESGDFHQQAVIESEVGDR